MASGEKIMEGATTETDTNSEPIPAKLYYLNGQFFTIVELLVVLAILGILLMLLIPALSKAKEEGKSMICKNNQKQIGLVINNYGEDYDGWIPPVRLDNDESTCSFASYWTNTQDLLLRHSNKHGYNTLYFDGHVTGNVFPNYPESLVAEWNRDNNQQ